MWPLLAVPPALNLQQMQACRFLRIWLIWHGEGASRRNLTWEEWVGGGGGRSMTWEAFRGSMKRWRHRWQRSHALHAPCAPNTEASPVWGVLFPTPLPMSPQMALKGSLVAPRKLPNLPSQPLQGQSLPRGSNCMVCFLRQPPSGGYVECTSPSEEWQNAWRSATLNVSALLYAL